MGWVVGWGGGVGWCFFFFFNDTATTEIYTLSLHDALPIWCKYLLLGYWGFVMNPEEKHFWRQLWENHQNLKDKWIPKIFVVAYLWKAGISSKTRRWKIQANREWSFIIIIRKCLFPNRYIISNNNIPEYFALFSYYEDFFSWSSFKVCWLQRKRLVAFLLLWDTALSPLWKSLTYHWLWINGDLSKMGQTYRAKWVSILLNAYLSQESVRRVKQ